MKEMKRVLALLLCLVMLVGVLPVSALAHGNKHDGHKDKFPEETVVVEESVPETTETVPVTDPTEETIPETSEETIPETTEETVPETTEETIPETTEETIPETSEETVPETTEETIPEEALLSLASEDAEETSVTLSVPSDDELKAEMENTQTYVNYMMSENDPETVVKNFGTHFTWDTEKRESSKSYLYDWSYYNGVVFEGLEYLYEVTGNVNYKNYVVEYMSSMIDENGDWAVCTNDSSKECAGYVDYHGADCYKTASLLMDLYKKTGDSRYQTMAQTLYADLDAAANSYLLSNAGNNFRHTWASDPSYDLWLDGLYMILPFRAEYAAATNDTEELAQIVSRLTWVSENMYNSSNGLFYHAANSASNNSGTYWLRSMGWYAAAIADVMDHVSSDQRATLAAQLTKLADGLKAYYNEGGMWLNNLAAEYSASGNPYETSGTALVCYALLKAVNNGWIDDSYADMALTAYYTITAEKLDSSNTTLTDICQKGAPTSSNSSFADNEGKGVGPYIMLYAEVMEYTGYTPTQPEEPETEEPEVTEPAEPKEQTVSQGDLSMTVSGVSAELTGAALAEADKALLDEKGYDAYVALDVTGELAEGETATFTVAIPDGWDAARVVGISVEDGVVVEIPGTAAEGMFTFTVDHFSGKGIALTAEPAEESTTNSVSGEGYLAGGTTYTLDTDGVTANKKYLIVSGSSGDVSALTNNDGSATGTDVTVNGSGTGSTITVDDDTNIAWTFSGTTSGTVGNDGNYLYPERNNLALQESGTSLTISNQNNGAYALSRRGNNTYYVRYNNGWTGARGNTVYYVYLYEYTSSSAGEAVTFTVNPGSASLMPGDTATLTGTVTVAGETVDLSDCTITWASSDADCATVSGGTVTGVADGTANITATLSAVDGTALQEAIVLTIPVTVQSKTVVSIALSDDYGTVVKNRPAATTVLDENGEAVKVTVTYDDGSIDEIDLTLGMLSSGYDITTPGTYSDLTVTYGGKSVGGFTLNVLMNPGNNYPEYPNPGSVDLNKVIGNSSQFQDTGVAEVQLSTSGLPIKTGVDVVLTIDISNSMAWETGTTDDNFTANKLTEVMTAVKNFATIFLADNEDGTATDNTVTIVTFAGYDADNSPNQGTYVDSVRTLVSATSSVDVINAIANNTKFTTHPTGGDYQIQIAYVPADSDQNAVSSVVTADADANRGDTNYDYAFWQTEQAIIDANLGNDGREVHVLFMTDGCASNFNGDYYRTSNAGYYYLPDTTTGYSGATYANGTAWTDHIEELIKETGGNTYAMRVSALVDGIYAVGFDMANGSFSGITTWDTSVDWEAVFNNIVSKVVTDEDGNGLIDVTAASDTDTLNAFYETLASELRYAATNAYYVDEMGDSFDLQLGNYVTKFAGTTNEYTIALNPAPAITVSTYNIYKSSDIGSEIGGVTVTQAMVGERYGDPTVIETVVFNADGTAAYSSVDGYDPTTNGTDTDGNAITDYTGDTNILVNGVIYAKNFWYNTTAAAVMIDTDGDGVNDYSLPAETFRWNIGTINDKEFVLSYYVYLEGSAEGQAPAGSYATNNQAILYYTNYLDNDVNQEVQSPTLAWQSASVSYGFYLVDENGNPITNQTTGSTGSFYDAVKVTKAVLYQNMNLNSTTSVTINLLANTVLPKGYEAYDTSAQYTITVDSNSTASGWEIVVGNGLNATTYVTDFYENLASNETSEDDNTYDYTATTVWFAVKFTRQALPDTVVIDYGLPVDISVLANDMFGEDGKLAGVGAFDSTDEDNDDVADMLKRVDATMADGFGTSYTGRYGVATANTTDGTVRYTLNTSNGMQMQTYEKFAYAVNYTGSSNAGYYYDTVTVIPATTIYYEDEFVTYSAQVWDTATNGWVAESADTTDPVWTYVSNSAAVQDEDRPGEYSLTDANNIYGYDSANLSMSKFSLNGYAKANVNYDQLGKATFTFYGTGFDIISMTDNTTGTIIVDLYEGSEVGANVTDAIQSYVVDTYYGYAPNCYKVVMTYGPVTTTDDNGIETTTNTWVETRTVITEDAYKAAVSEEPIEEPVVGSTYTYYELKWEPVEATDNAQSAKIYQVPVIQMENLPYGQYTAQIRVTYETIFEHNEGSADYDFYLDAIRIYDPANDGAADSDTVIEDAYVADGEGWPSYIELRNKLIAIKTLGNADTSTAITGLVFIDGDAEVGDAQLSDYVSYGPNNEVYLAPGQRVAFKLTDVTDSEGESIVANIHIGIKSANGDAATYTITNIDDDTDDTTDTDQVAYGGYHSAHTSTISTTTDMYYDLTNYRDDIIVISNYTQDTGTNGIISLTNIKATYTQNPNAVAVASEDYGIAVASEDEGIAVASEEAAANEVGIYMTPAAATLTLRSLNAASVEEVPEETEPEVSEPEESTPETSEPEESIPETTVPEETKPEVTEPEVETVVRETVTKIVNTVKNLLSNLFGKWF